MIDLYFIQNFFLRFITYIHSIPLHTLHINKQTKNNNKHNKVKIKIKIIFIFSF